MNELGAKGIPFFFMFDFEGKRPVVAQLDDLAHLDILLDTPVFSNWEKEKIGRRDIDVSFEKFPISFDDYKPKFDRILNELNFGNSYLINLTQPTKISTNLSLQEIFEFSEAKFKLRYKNQFVVFSPERFIEIKANKIFTHPMKGTIDATLPDAKEKLLADQKELAEHYTIVDLLRNDLNLVAKKIRVNNFRYIDKINTNNGSLLQASTEISGELTEDWKSKIGTIFSTLLPAGSVTGAPKRKTVEIIKETECYERGWYTGVFGIFDGKSVDSAVMIRFIEKQKDGQMVFKSGGGITAKSDARAEYNELIQKVYVPIARNNTVGERQTDQSPAPSETSQLQSKRTFR